MAASGGPLRPASLEQTNGEGVAVTHAFVRLDGGDDDEDDVHQPDDGQQQEAAKAGLMQAVNQLSIAIYTRFASSHLEGLGQTIQPNSPAASKRLQWMAKHAHKAAQAYFEALGVCTYDDLTTHTPKNKEEKT